MAKGSIKEKKTLPSPINNQMINYKIYYMSIPEKILYCLLIFAIGGFVGWVFYGGLFKLEGEPTLATQISDSIVVVLTGSIAIRVFFPALRNLLKARRDKALRTQFRDLLESLTALLASGNTVADSFSAALKDLSNQYTKSDYIIIELNEIVAGVNNGYTLEEMLNAFGERSDSEDVQNFSNVISNCYRMGGDFKIVVRKTRDIISDKMMIEDEVATKISSNKLQLNVMCVMPVVLVAMLKTSNGSFGESLTSPIGVVAATIAVCIFLASYFWGRKIIDIR